MSGYRLKRVMSEAMLKRGIVAALCLMATITAVAQEKGTIEYVTPSEVAGQAGKYAIVVIDDTVFPSNSAGEEGPPRYEASHLSDVKYEPMPLPIVTEANDDPDGEETEEAKEEAASSSPGAGSSVHGSIS